MTSLGSLMALAIGLMACVFAPATATRSPTPSAAVAATLTPSPTFTPLPTPTGLLPMPPVTPPPPGWTPLPPSPWPIEGDTADWTRAYIRLATDLLNTTGGDPDAFLAQVRAWAPTPTPYPTLTATPAFPRPTATPTPLPPTATASPPPTRTPPGPPPTPAVGAVTPTPAPLWRLTPTPAPTTLFTPSPTALPSGPTATPAPQRRHPASAWAYIADTSATLSASLDDDGALEWLVSLPHLEQQCSSGRCTTFFRCEVGLCPGLVLLFEREGRTFTPVHLLTSGLWSGELESP